MATDFRTLLVRTHPRRFEHIFVGNYELSIQASKSHYCRPRETLGDSRLYTHFEVGVFLNGEWVLFAPDDVLSEGPWMEFTDMDYYEGMSNNVLRYVPVEVVQKLYERLLELSN